jgi:hypothetical protein
VLVGVGVAVVAGGEVKVTVGVSVAVGVGLGVAVGVVIRSTTPRGAKRNWNTVTMATASGRIAILRYSPNSARTELRNFFSLVQSSLEDTATKGNCQV